MESIRDQGEGGAWERDTIKCLGPPRLTHKLCICGFLPKQSTEGFETELPMSQTSHAGRGGCTHQKHGNNTVEF